MIRSAHRSFITSIAATALCGMAIIPIAGCGSQTPVTQAALVPTYAPVSFEASAEQLVSSRLTLEQTRQGWVRLFDGFTLFGWEIAEPANWRVEDGAIVVDSGAVGLLCTSVAWSDFELTLEFQADAETNSGVFLRTPLKPTDPSLDCYEVNIAPTSNPFPSGSIVMRSKVVDGQPGSAASPLDASQWHRLTMIAQGAETTIQINHQTVCKYVDPKPLAAGRIGLQHNKGKVAFRDIRLRPLNLQPMLDSELTKWTMHPDKVSKFDMTDKGELRVSGGRGRIETKDSFKDFVAHLEAKSISPAINSGVFFRCIPASMMDGYECQIEHGIHGNDPLAPLDCGTGGIFRRKDARLVLSKPDQWFSMLVVADGRQIATWVDGVQVVDWQDTRPAHENPRQGSRMDAGTIMLQAHDPTTDILFRNLQIAAFQSTTQSPN